MLDPKRIRGEPERVRQGLKARGYDPALVDQFLVEDQRWREILGQSEQLKQKRNQASEEIGRLKKKGEDAQSRQEEVRQINERIKILNRQLEDSQEKLDQLLLFFPNPPHSTVPCGAGSSANQVVKTHGEEKEFSFSPLPHWEIAEHLKLIDFARAAKLSGSLFALYMGMGAKLQRALIQFMLDFHLEKHGYTEVYPPFLVREEIMRGTGQLPKFREEMYACEADNLFLIPTAEVPVTNLHADEILRQEDLPRSYVSYTACFRREAGAAGTDTRGLQRLHQFDKVELVKLVTPESSYEEHEKLLLDVEEIVRSLELPYRVLLLCAGDLGFSAAKCYDVEVWCPGQKKWLEISSCSNFEDFQARRANIRFRRDPQARPEFVHTLNASGVALPRTFIAVLENYQEPDGSFSVPKVLQPYLGNRKKIEV